MNHGFNTFIYTLKKINKVSPLFNSSLEFIPTFEFIQIVGVGMLSDQGVYMCVCCLCASIGKLCVAR